MKNILVGQSGGPTAVINSSICGVITEAKNHNEITVVQIFKTKPGGHCGCGFRRIPASVRTDFVNCISLKDTASHSQNNTC